MTRRLLVAAVVAVLVGVAGMVAVSAGTPRPVTDLAYVEAQAGDSYWGIARQLGLSCTHTELFAANGRAVLDPGTIVLIPPRCQPGVATTSTTVAATTTAAPTTTVAATTTTVAPTTTVKPTTTTTSTTSTTVPTPSGVQFFEGFDSDQRSRFEWQLQTTNVPPERDFLGEHDTACLGPDTYRTVHQVDLPFGQWHSRVNVENSEMVWWCAPGNDTAKGHMMTALDTDSIATLNFSPEQVFTDVRRVCWDQNMNNLGNGKWLNVFIVPNAAHTGDLAYAAGSGLDFGGVPQRLPAGAVDFTWLRGSIMSHKVVAGGGYEQQFYQWMSIDPVDTNGDGMITSADAPTRGMATNPAPRFTICVDDAANTVTIERPNGTTDTYPYAVQFPTGQVRVIFQDASYNPTKHNGSEHHLTWHWDNITVA